MLTKKDLNQVKRKTGVSLSTIGEYLEMDFEDREDEVTTEELIDHIQYQEQILRMTRSCDSETEFSEMWCSMF